MNCIEVSTFKNSHGYGRTYLPIGKGRSGIYLAAHVIAFEKTWGVKVRPGQVVMHTCDNPGCVNPLHLQLGTHGDNARDKVRKGRARNQNSNKTHCIRGHEFTETSTYLRPKGGRSCRTCRV